MSPVSIINRFSVLIYENRSGCSRMHEATLFCMRHRRCNDRCLDYRNKYIELFRFWENGSEYCQNCVDLNCPKCKRLIKVRRTYAYHRYMFCRYSPLSLFFQHIGRLCQVRRRHRLPRSLLSVPHMRSATVQIWRRLGEAIATVS